MNARRFSYYLPGALFAAIVLLLAACQPAAIVIGQQPTQPPAPPSATPVALPTQTPVQPSELASEPSGGFVVALSGIAQNMTVETVAAVPAGAEVAWTDAGPEFRRVTLQGYPVSDHSKNAQIFIYPVGDLASANEHMGKAAADLQALLQTRQAGDQLPYLPLAFSARQAMDVQVQYLDFKNGKGVRYLTQFNNGMAPINNYQLTYTFQGLTSDGKYYIATVLPVTNPELPANSQASQLMGTEYQDNLAKTAALLNQASASSFTPDLARLDAMIQSIEVK